MKTRFSGGFVISHVLESHAHESGFMERELIFHGEIHFCDEANEFAQPCGAAWNILIVFQHTKLLLTSPIKILKLDEY